MKVTAITRRALETRRTHRGLIRDGYEEVGERGGKLWELHRGCRTDHVITDVVIGPDGKSLFIKTAQAGDFKDVIANTFERWGLFQRPKLTREEVGKMVAISLGLGALFNESVEAERDWMRTPHSAFKTRPITMVLAGLWDEVLAQVNHERGL